MPSDNAQFIIESDEELPAGTRKPAGMSLRDTLRGGDRKFSHENAVHDVPELHHRHCQRRVQGPLEPGRPGSELTEIPFDDGGILEIYHLDR